MIFHEECAGELACPPRRRSPPPPRSRGLATSGPETYLEGSTDAIHAACPELTLVAVHDPRPAENPADRPSPEALLAFLRQDLSFSNLELPESWDTASRIYSTKFDGFHPMIQVFSDFKAADLQPEPSTPSLRYFTQEELSNVGC